MSNYLDEKRIRVNHENLMKGARECFDIESVNIDRPEGVEDSRGLIACRARPRMPRAQMFNIRIEWIYETSVFVRR